eukprot:GHRQ01017724.1.p1 GENE.GHRQ01017724.1~~GHRQ01017724.1.p1  ORF type:complete len:212 (+),score=39.13 GHRQ01017724.1:180-815(+)
MGLKVIFSKQLPNMPREYICRLLLDRRHRSCALVARNGQVLGGVTYRVFPQQVRSAQSGVFPQHVGSAQCRDVLKQVGSALCRVSRSRWAVHNVGCAGLPLSWCCTQSAGIIVSRYSKHHIKLFLQQLGSCLSAARRAAGHCNQDTRCTPLPLVSSATSAQLKGHCCARSFASSRQSNKQDGTKLIWSGWRKSSTPCILEGPPVQWNASEC